MKDAERYFALLEKRLRLELGRKKAKEIVEELDSHYRAKLIELRDQGIPFAEASKSALEELGPIDAIVEDYALPTGWMNLKPAEKQAVLISTLAILASIAFLAISDIVWGHSARHTAEFSLFACILAFGTLLLRTGFISGRLISRWAILSSLLAITVPTMLLSVFGYAQVNGHTFSVIRLRNIQRDEAAYSKKLSILQSEVSRGQAAFDNALKYYVEVEFNPVNGIVEVNRPLMHRTVYGCGFGGLLEIMVNAERSITTYKQGPSIDSFRTTDGYLVIGRLTWEECRVFDPGQSRAERYIPPTNRIAGIVYRDERSLTMAAHEWTNSLFIDELKHEVSVHRNAMEYLEPFFRVPLADRWSSATRIFKDYVIACFFWLFMMNLLGAALGVLWRTAGRRYDKLIRS